uniref:Uncharacterized protein n=1 Tax=Arundo donax TaxID=35708 RepID=A0A0A9GR20_ARUDO
MGNHFVGLDHVCTFHFISLLILYFVSLGNNESFFDLVQVSWSLNLINLLAILIMAWASVC